jgi:hypothetical protein
MADGIISTALTEQFRLLSGTTGETFTISAATKPDGTAWAGPTITEVGSGAYSLTFTPTLAGVYLATITGDTSGETFSGAWEILAAPTRSFTRRVDGAYDGDPAGQINAAHVNELQQAIEDLSH